ncbi:concanavalin A-like lectin/glucanase [Corynespora cassiicola Philippines]|uniref:chitinase n=1 Tax=Corynespora cassiicola Philippines TaxID=1448308 RepID=A0A2T2P4E9_CORCC|nr:concanavalin A-like lectin/glucanase [Corynespora cassiicola Philippines]
MRFTPYIAASALAALANAQTFTDCNPTEKDCPNDPAIAANFETDFKAGKDAVKGWKQTAGTLNYVAEGAEFTIAKKGDAPTIQTEGYLHFGYVEVKCKASPGAGVVSSIVLQSEALDEVDYEFIGNVNNKVQTNYFGKGNTTTYDRMIEADVNNIEEFHTYALNWTAEAITFIVNNQPVRTLKYAEANGGKNYPQTPSNVRIGIWAGGDPDNDEGTIQWAHGPINYNDAPFTMTVDSVKIINYSPGKEYEWTDKSGDWQSIKVIEPGNTEGAPQNSAVIAPSPTSGSTGGSGGSGGSGSSDGSSDGAVSPPAQPSAPANGTNSDPECDCGVATVTVTGTPPAGETPAPPAGETPTPAVPPVDNPPYPTTTAGGLIVETSPAPSVPFPTAPSAGIPGNGTNPTAPPAQFTGAASSNKVGAVVGAVAGAMLFAF